jgi:uncharacterized protein (DUF362 family)
MDRRRFIGSLSYGILSLSLAGCSFKSFGQAPHADPGGGQKPPAPAGNAYDKGKLVVAEGTEPVSLLERGFNALGGINALVKKGATVVIKPNFSVPRRPEVAATTSPQLVSALVKQCLAAGAKEVKVIDYPFSGGRVSLETSGIRKAVEAAGGKAYNINEQSFFRQVDIGGKVLKTALFSQDVLNADVFINFPILKHHNGTRVTMGIKNMMGLVWDRGFFHRTDLEQTIAELSTFRKPDLTILDATRGITDNGPMGPGPIREYNQVVFGVDPVAVDSYGAALFGVSPAELKYLATAAQLGVGEIDIKKLTVVKV